MAQPRETDEFMRALAKFDQDSAQVQSTQERLKAEHKKLVEQRRLALEQRLAEEGLVRCARTHTSGETEEERLGLVREDDVTLVRSTFGHSMDPHYRIEALCPQHRPEGPNRSARDNWYYWGAIETVVVRIGDRLIQSIDGEDVTHLKVVTGGFTEELYRHFGLSPVPSLPRQ
ncbi:MAG: hypothetical protein HYV38_03355 [Candidatus Levybacteria bacterium]|nr:hypothetical protein [Candidatus Levybacteria bacterium]